jgi:hypothetical protein
LRSTEFNPRRRTLSNTVVERILSVKRGTLYNAEKLDLVRCVHLRLRGQKSGVKLWDMLFIENWIRGEMQKS